MFITITDVVGVQIVNEMVRTLRSHPHFIAQTHYIRLEKFNFHGYKEYADSKTRPAHRTKQEGTTHSNRKFSIGLPSIHD